MVWLILLLLLLLAVREERNSRQSTRGTEMIGRPIQPRRNRSGSEEDGKRKEGESRTEREKE